MAAKLISDVRPRPFLPTSRDGSNRPGRRVVVVVLDQCSYPRSSVT